MVLLPQQLDPLIREPDPTTHTPTSRAFHHPPHGLCVPGVSAVDLPVVPSAAVTFLSNILGLEPDVGYYRVEGVGFCCQGEVAAFEARGECGDAVAAGAVWWAEGTVGFAGAGGGDVGELGGVGCHDGGSP